MIVCREATLKDCDPIVEIHLQSFKSFFLTSLGDRFLKTFYRSCIKSNETVIIVCCNDEEKMAGFAMGCLRADGFYKRLLLKNLLPFSLEAARIFISKPGALVRLVNNLTKTEVRSESQGHSELLSIASCPEFKGQGTGKRLLDYFEERIKEKGGRVVSLTTDYYNNENVIQFYTKSGYEIDEDFVAYPDRRMYRMIKRLRPVD
jgi:ribosomal protein S18 acetylase RimI-like enzyme